MREIFPGFRFHTYRTESKVTYKFDIEPCGQNEMAPKLSYKYEIENQEKSLSQAKCPLSLTALYGQIIRVILTVCQTRIDPFESGRDELGR